MKSFKFCLVLVALFAMFASCSKVPAGNVGVKVYLLGSSKGVDNQVLGVGRYYIGINEELYLYPTYQINYVYTASKVEGKEVNEEFTFQTKEGMECSVDLGVALHFDPDKIAHMFQTYRKGEEDIMGIVVRNSIRDALNKEAGSMPIESVYGEGKGKLINSIQDTVSKQLKPNGIVIDKLSLVGSIRIPKSVKDALDSKVAMTQEAQKAENQVVKARADADIAVAIAEGKAKSLLVEAQAQAQANKILSASITPTLVNYKAIEAWDGKLPTVSGANTPFINLK